MRQGLHVQKAPPPNAPLGADFSAKLQRLARYRAVWGDCAVPCAHAVQLSTCQCLPHLQCSSVIVLVWRDSAAPIIPTMMWTLRNVLLSTSVTCTNHAMSCGAGPRLLGSIKSERGFTVAQCWSPYHQLSAGQAPLLGGPGTGGVGQPAAGGRARAPPDADTARSARRPGLLLEIVNGGCQPA